MVFSTLSTSSHFIPDSSIGGYDSRWDPSLPSPPLSTPFDFLDRPFCSCRMYAYVVSCILVIKRAIEHQLLLRSIEQHERQKNTISVPVNVSPCSRSVSSAG